MIFMTLASRYTFLAMGICADGISQCCYSGTHEESEKMKCFYLDHNSKTNSPID